MALSIIYAFPFPSCARTLKHKSESHFCFALVETWQSDCSIQTQHTPTVGWKTNCEFEIEIPLPSLAWAMSCCTSPYADSGIRMGWELASSSHTAWCSAISLDDGTLIARVISVTKQNTSNPILEPTHTRCLDRRRSSQDSLSARTQRNPMIGKDLSMRNHLLGTFFGCWWLNFTSVQHCRTDVYQNQGHWSQD